MPVLLEIRRRLRGRRVVFLGIGDVDRGDDGFGPSFVRALEARGLPDGWTVLEAGTAPERWIGRALRDRPEIIVFVDAAALGAAAGTVDLLPAEAAAGWAPSTHGVPLAALADWLRQSSGADTLLLAVEPRRLGRGEGLSPEVERALAGLIGALAAESR